MGRHYICHYFTPSDIILVIILHRAIARCNAELTEKGYPDIGWDPVEGERFMDFLRFCVWVNGK
jgi:hypothetical protein